MLIELTVRNLAIFEDVRVPFSAGLNVVTGETGAGKSSWSRRSASPSARRPIP